MVSFSTDFNQGQTASTEALFSFSGTWPLTGTWADWIALNGGVWPGGAQVNARMLRQAIQGTSLSTQFSNSPSSPDWSIHRFVRHLRETREASIL
jgi:hypothetical protein